MEIPAVLRERYRRLFRFYDRNGDGVHTLGGDFDPVARAIAARRQGRFPSPFPDLLGLLMATYRHENRRRDRDGNGVVDLEEFITSHGRVLAAFRATPRQARAFLEKAAGGFFDVLDLDGDGALELADLEAFARAYGHDVGGIGENLAGMLADLGLPPGRLPRAAFLTLVEQYWFDPSPKAPGRRLFEGVGLAA
ncbi:MAG: EF-hand domain-containing protein [Synechococcaceae cyanobacterium]|nr:EF-hand domain-containing protein [Synechococcaceae cyanobacterium]